MAARRHKDMKRVREKQITRTKVFSEEFFGVFFGMDFSGWIFREGFFGRDFSGEIFRDGFFGRDFSGIVLYGVDVIPRIVVCRQ